MLFNLDKDIAEADDLADQNQELVESMTERFRILVDRGSSRPGAKSENDAPVDFETVQTERWALWSE